VEKVDKLTLQEEREIQATRFAAALLPLEEFRKVWKRYGGNVGLIAGHFEVPEQFVRIRARYAIPPCGQ
jgi:Zn-dependent peptidase ImmA (M78 family)